jgi:hypothetical protein
MNKPIFGFGVLLAFAALVSLIRPSSHLSAQTTATDQTRTISF